MSPQNCNDIPPKAQFPENEMTKFHVFSMNAAHAWCVVSVNDAKEVNHFNSCKKLLNLTIVKPVNELLWMSIRPDTRMPTVPRFIVCIAISVMLLMVRVFLWRYSVATRSNIDPAILVIIMVVMAGHLQCHSIKCHVYLILLGMLYYILLFAIYISYAIYLMLSSEDSNFLFPPHVHGSGCFSPVCYLLKIATTLSHLLDIALATPCLSLK